MSEDALKRISEHCEFKTMKQNQMSNYSLVPQAVMDNKKSPFLRKGRAKHFSPSVFLLVLYSHPCVVFRYWNVLYLIFAVFKELLEIGRIISAQSWRQNSTQLFLKN